MIQYNGISEMLEAFRAVARTTKVVVVGCKVCRKGIKAFVVDR